MPKQRLPSKQARPREYRAKAGVVSVTHLTQVKWTKHRRGIIEYRMKVLDIEDAEIAIKSRPFWAVPWKVVRACVLMSMLHFMLTLMRCVTVAG